MADFTTTRLNAIKRLQSGESWGSVWNSVKKQFPTLSDKFIDEQLGGSGSEGTGWAKAGAYQQYKASQKVKETLAPKTNLMTSLTPKKSTSFIDNLRATSKPVIDTTPIKQTIPAVKKTGLIDSLKKSASIIPKIGEAFGGFATEVVTSAPKSGTQLGLYAAKKLKGKESISYKPQDKLSKAILGQEVKDVETTGQEMLRGLGVKESTSKKYGLAVGGALALSDLIPGGTGEKTLGKKAISLLAKEKDVSKVSKVLKGIGATDEAIKTYAPKIAKTADVKVVENSLNELYKLRKSLPESSVALQNAPEATKVSKLISSAKNKISTTGSEIKDIEKKIVDQKFRGDKLNLSDDLLSEIEKRRDILGLEKREVRTFGDMQEAAAEIGTDPKNLLRDITTNRITDKEVVGLRDLINNNAEFIAKTEKEIIDNPKESVLLKQKIGVAQTQIDQALNKLIKGGTEAGRTIASFRILANKTLEPQFWFTQAQKMLGNRELTDEMKSAIIELSKKSDRQGLANFVSMLRKPTLSEKAITLWKAGLLTSPTTHIANITGNTAMMSLNNLSDVVATGLDTMASLATGKRTITINPSTIAAEVKGAIKGLKDSKSYLKTGIYADELLNKYDLPRNVNFDNKLFNGYTQAIFRSLGAEDLVFRKASIGKSLEKQANIIAMNEKLVGGAKKSRISELLQNPTNEMITNAIDAAEYATFQGKNVLNDMISGAKRGVAGKSELGGAAIELVAPFTKTPTNVAARIADYSPLGFIKAMVGVAKPSTRSQEKFITDLSRAITGTGMIAFGAYLAEKGLMTGNLPTSQKERDQFYAEGKQPNSIRLGDKWYQLNRISPVGNLLSIGAEFNETSKEKQGLGLVSATGMEAAKGLTEQTFLKGVSGGLKAITEPDRYAASFTENTVASLVPSIIGKTAKTIDPNMRVSEGILQAIQEKIPVMSKGLPVRRDIFGEKVEVSGGKYVLIDPFNTKKAVDSPIINEAKNLDITIGMPSQTINGVKLNNVEYEKYSKVVGKLTKASLDAMLDSDEYNQMSNVEKKKLFNKTIEDVKDSVNEQFFSALMIKRYDLPTDTNPEILTQLITELNKNERFKKSDDKKKGKVIKKLIDGIQPQ